MSIMAKRVVAATAGILLIAIAVWFGLCVRSQAKLTEMTRRLPVQRPAPAASSVDVVYATLSPGEVEEDADNLPRVTVTPSTGTVAIELQIPTGGYARYNVDLATEEGRAVNRQESLQSGRHRGEESLTVYYRAALLENRNYVIHLTGMNPGMPEQPVARYALRVKR
jgi:hypothetical protein